MRDYTVTAQDFFKACAFVEHCHNTGMSIPGVGYVSSGTYDSLLSAMIRPNKHVLYTVNASLAEHLGLEDLEKKALASLDSRIKVLPRQEPKDRQAQIMRKKLEQERRAEIASLSEAFGEDL